MRRKQAPTILVADDFEDMRTMLRLWLERLGFHVVEALDGEQAIEIARAKRPDLILMDIDMPQRSGISATYKIRKDPELRGIPIVAITAYETAELHEDALKAGGLECIIKPIDTNRLEKILRRLL
jgi:CheY-like chemotaxis protein